MKVEFIVDKKEYKKLLCKDKFSERIKYRSEQVKGKNNYLLTLECEGKSVSTAKTLSESRIIVDKLFVDNNVKYRLLTEEASQFFVQKLYPYACRFETKLRKFIYTALFDIDEKAESTILKAYKSTLGSDAEKNLTKLPLSDFLSEKNLGDIFDFLFANDEFLSQVKALSTPKNNHQKHTTKKEILEKLNSLNDKTVWALIFAPIFEDSVLPKIYKDIQCYRNKVMHLHNIDYKNYTQALKSFTKGI